MPPDSEKVAQLIADVAAAEVMSRFERLERGDVTEKRPGDLVTVADVAAERRLSRILIDLLPGSLVVGEEAAAANPGVLDALGGEAPVWVVDPIDGTSNFAAGIPVFAVMVALVRRGDVVMGWIHDPVKRLTATAIKGEGAFCDGKRLQVASATGGKRSGNRQLARRIEGRSNLLDEVFDLRCAGHEYLALAGGQAQFAFYNRLNPWDHAPGQLLHREAGGFTALLDGSPYTTRKPAGGLLLAPDEASWAALREILIANR